jgi:ribosomal protein S14
MSMVRFATTCDTCGQRSEEYTAWGSCRCCLRDVCLTCRWPGTTIDADLDQPETALCRECVAEYGEDAAGKITLGDGDPSLGVSR